MNRKHLAISLVIFLAVLWFLPRQKSKMPPGPFDWQKLDIRSDRPLDSFDNQVFDSVDTMKKTFDIGPGDECYFLQGEDWIWRDTKDPSIQLVPVFCPKKGGGWTMPSSAARR